MSCIDISKALVDKLRRIRFHVAIYDTWNLGVLPVLRIIGARATVAVSVTAPQAVFLYYLGTPLPDTVPGFVYFH
jgi:hypothetical protein